ncbi:MAG: hypothetical protein ACUVR2_07125 [Anaerolineae bacterium]
MEQTYAWRGPQSTPGAWESVEKVHIVMLNEVKHLAKPRHLAQLERGLLQLHVDSSLRSGLAMNEVKG